MEAIAIIAVEMHASDRDLESVILSIIAIVVAEVVVVVRMRKGIEVNSFILLKIHKAPNSLFCFYLSLNSLYIYLIPKSLNSHLQQHTKSSPQQVTRAIRRFQLREFQAIIRRTKP